MSTEIKKKLKPAVDDLVHDRLLQSHDSNHFNQEQMSIILVIASRSYAAIEAKEHGCSLLSFLGYLTRGCDDPLAVIIEIAELYDKYAPINPELTASREWVRRHKRWTQKAVTISPVTGGYLCPTCSAPVPRDFQNYCGNCAQALDWSEVFAEALF